MNVCICVPTGTLRGSVVTEPRREEPTLPIFSDVEEGVGIAIMVRIVQSVQAFSSRMKEVVGLVRLHNGASRPIFVACEV